MSKQFLTWVFHLLISLRKSKDIFNSHILATPLELNCNSVYSFVKKVNEKILLCLFNFSEDRQFVQVNRLRDFLIEGQLEDLISGRVVNFNGDSFQMGPYEHFWLYGES